jgi:hypothetical protein
VRKLEKNRLVQFIGKVMEESGFKVYKDFKTSRHVIDIYGVLSTVVGDMGVVVAVKNYDEEWEVGLDVLKEMEMIGKTLKASKIVVVTSSYFTNSAINYGGRRNIKLIDKDGLVSIAKKFSKKEHNINEQPIIEESDDSDNYLSSKNSSRLTPSIFSSGKRGSLSKGGKTKSPRPSYNFDNIMPQIKAILSNTLALIVIVLLLSTLITDIIGLFNKSTALIGISKILSSALLAYGLVFAAEKDLNVTLTKGTIVFFVSMLIYVVLVIIL